MSSILRSGKLLRYFAGFTRNVVNTVQNNDSANLLQNTTCMCSPFQQSFASNAAPIADLNLDKQLRRLDNDVRRIGRISRRDIEDVLEEIRLQRSATSSQSLLVIRCCGNLVPEELPEVRTTLVQEIWKTLNALNVPMDISHYNALLRVYLENEHPFAPTDFLTEIESKSIEPNRVTYQRLITRYCQQGDIEGATRILEFMREKKLPVNENVFNSLILGHSQANDMESAKGILSVMKQAGLEPSADTYTTLLCCYARHGDLDAILTTLEECEKAEIFLLDKDLLDIIYTLTINGFGEKVDAVLEKLHKSMGFNQDAVNTILRLVNKGYEDVGLKILRLMPRSVRLDGTPSDVGTFFVKQLVRANRPVEKILSICKTLQEEGLNPKALIIATEAGLTNGIVNNALPLLKEMKNAGLPIRQHYFWPLICSVESNEIIDVIRHMQEEFSLYPTAETIRDYVIPNLKEKNWEKVLKVLHEAGVSYATAASSAAYSALNSNQIEQAAKIMESHKAYYMPQLFKQQLSVALAKTNNYPAFIRIVRHIYEGVNHRNAVLRGGESEVENIEVEATESPEVIETPEAGNGDTFPDVVGWIVNDVCKYFRTNRIEVLENVLPALVEEGLSISNANATRISERIGAEMTPKISELLSKLSSGELEPKPLKNNGMRKRGLDTLSVDEIERIIVKAEGKGENTANLKRNLLQVCFRSKNLPKTLQVIEKLESEQYTITAGQSANLIDLYALDEKPSEALALYDTLKKKDPEFILDNLKTMRVVSALLKEERVDDALKFLDRNKKTEILADGEAYTNVSSVWRILNTLAEAGDAHNLRRVFDALVEANYILPNNIILGPLIKVYLIKDDVKKAIETFEEACEKYKCTPWKNELACRLIQMEDATSLQKLTDLSTNIHGEVNSLYDLVFSFVECGRIRQARKILETPGLRTRPHRIDSACERYKNEGMVQPLEGLIEATKDLSHIDRIKIYYNLLLSYCSSGDAEKGLGLWTKMQEDGVAPTDEFLNKLAELLAKKNMDIPFVVPEKNPSRRRAEGVSVKSRISTKQEPLKKDSVTPGDTTAPQKTQLSRFRKAIKDGDADGAINCKNELNSKETISILDVSLLIEVLVRGERLTEATKYVNELLTAKHYPLPKIFKFYLNKVAAAGDIATIESVGHQLTKEQKKLISYDNRLCHANIVAGRIEPYLKNLADEIDNVKSPEEAAEVAERFPRGGALGILEKHPEMTPQFEKLAEKFAEHKQLGPMNVLWMHLISQGNEAASKEIWNKHLSNTSRLMFQRVLQTARHQKDEKLANSVISQLRESKISEGAIGNAYSCLIDIHISNANYTQGLDTLNTAIKDVCLENINRTALQRLKDGLEEQKKEFPYTIPEKKSKASSSSSSSNSDDVTPERPETRPGPPKLTKSDK